MKINPVAFSIAGFDIRWYGIFIGIGAMLAITLGEKLGKKNGLKEGLITDFAIYALIFGILGARLYYVIFEWDYYSNHLDEILSIRNGGLAIYGGILTGIVVATIFSKIKKVSLVKILDSIAPGVVLAQGIGRWGNFTNGEAHGEVTNVPWAILVDGKRVHPTFLYESIIDVSIFLLLYFYFDKKKKFDGQITALYLIFYGLGRFFVEGMRTDSLYLGPIRISQLVSLVLVACGVVYFIIKRKDL